MKHVAVTAAAIRQNGLYLLCRRRRSADLPGKWEFPGGKIEPGETPESCIIREIREELGLEVVPERRLGTVEHDDGARRLVLIVFCGEINGGNLEVRDHEEIAWVSPDRILTYDLAPADVEVGRWIADGACYRAL